MSYRPWIFDEISRLTVLIFEFAETRGTMPSIVQIRTCMGQPKWNLWRQVFETYPHSAYRLRDLLSPSGTTITTGGIPLGSYKFESKERSSMRHSRKTNLPTTNHLPPTNSRFLACMGQPKWNLLHQQGSIWVGGLIYDPIWTLGDYVLSKIQNEIQVRRICKLSGPHQEQPSLLTYRYSSNNCND